MSMRTYLSFDVFKRKRVTVEERLLVEENSFRTVDRTIFKCQSRDSCVWPKNSMGNTSVTRLKIPETQAVALP